MQIKFRGNRVGVEKLNKKGTKNTGSFIVMPEGEGEEYVGIVKFVGEEAAKDIKVGQKVYFNTNFQYVLMTGTKICVMTDDNITAVVDEEQAKTIV